MELSARTWLQYVAPLNSLDRVSELAGPLPHSVSTNPVSGERIAIDKLVCAYDKLNLNTHDVETSMRTIRRTYSMAKMSFYLMVDQTDLIVDYGHGW